MNKIKQHGRECADIKYKIEMALGIGYKGRRADATKAKRIYCQVCRDLGYSTTEIGIPFEWDHTVVCYHLRKLRSDEIETAHTLSSQLKSPTPPPPQIIVKEKNIYELTGFRYDQGRKETSTKWRRPAQIRVNASPLSKC